MVSPINEQVSVISKQKTFLSAKVLFCVLNIKESQALVCGDFPSHLYCVQYMAGYICRHNQRLIPAFNLPMRRMAISATARLNRKKLVDVFIEMFLKHEYYTN